MKTPAGAGAGAIVLLVALLLVAPAIAAPPAASRSGLAGATARPISVAAGISSAGVSPTATKSRTPRLTVAAATPAAEHKPAEFLVGFDKEDITPTNLPFSYLGGQGYERVGTTVVSPLYVRTMAVAAATPNGKQRGQPIVIASVDSQGYFDGYQSGPGGVLVADYGYDQIRDEAAAAAGIPAGNIVFSSTHSHTAPDTIGLWGGAPSTYFEQFRHACELSVARAIAAMQPASFRHGDADGSRYTYNPFPTNAQNDQYSDPTIWPLYGTLSVLQAISVSTGTPIVTLFDYGTHPDILEGSPLISPDWPAWTISHVETAYGGNGMFLAGVVGDEPVFPGGDTQPHTNAYLLSEATTYASEINVLVDAALAGARPVDVGGVGAQSINLQIPATNALLLGDDAATLPQPVQDQQHLGHVTRAIVPPYLTGNVLGTWASTMRIGDGILFNTPGESYSDVFFAAHDQVSAGWYLVSGLADDQIGYIVMPAEWPVVVAEDPLGRSLDIVGPLTGSYVVSGLLLAAQQLGFRVNLQPGDLVADGDPVLLQMQQCLQQNCQQYLPVPVPVPSPLGRPAH